MKCWTTGNWWSRFQKKYFVCKLHKPRWSQEFYSVIKVAYVILFDDTCENPESYISEKIGTFLHDLFNDNSNRSVFYPD